MSTGSPDARGLVAPEAREALRRLGVPQVYYDARMSEVGRERYDAELAVVEAELERLAAENRSLHELVDGLMDDKARLAADDVRRVPPLVRQTLERALRLDMTEPPVTNAEIRAALDLLPPSPSFYRSVTGMEQLAAAEDEVERLRGALEEIDSTDFDEPSDFSELGRIARAALAGDTGEAGT